MQHTFVRSKKRTEKVNKTAPGPILCTHNNIHRTTIATNGSEAARLRQFPSPVGNNIWGWNKGQRSNKLVCLLYYSPFGGQCKNGTLVPMQNCFIPTLFEL